MERRIEALLIGLYERHGPVGALWRLEWMIVPEAIFVGLGLQSRYMQLSLVRSLLCAAIASFVLVASSWWGLLAFRRSIDGLDPNKNGLLLEFPMRLIKAVVGRLALLTVPTLVTVYAVASGQWSLLSMAETAGGAVIAIITSTAGIYAAASTMTGLIAAKTGLIQRSPTVDLGLAPRLALYFGVLSISTGAVVGALTLRPGDRGALMQAYGLSAVGSAIFLVTVAIPVTMSVLNPVRHLIAGTRAVTGGDLDARVPVTSADELGELASSFNSMISTLQETSDGLRASSARVVVASDHARRQVERDLHDGAQQSLLLLNLKLSVIQRKLTEEPAAADLLLTEARADLMHALQELRDLAHGMYPEILASDGVPAALTSAGRSNPPVVEATGFGRYATEIEAAIYFCCLEAIQNAGKYAGPEAQIRVLLVERGASLHFEVADNGVGFDRSLVKQDAFHNMSDRIGALSGTVVIDSLPGSGTRVSGSVPRKDR